MSLQNVLFTDIPPFKIGESKVLQQQLLFLFFNVLYFFADDLFIGCFKLQRTQQGSTFSDLTILHKNIGLQRVCLPMADILIRNNRTAIRMKPGSCELYMLHGGTQQLLGFQSGNTRQMEVGVRIVGMQRQSFPVVLLCLVKAAL
ncbi:hypothetical protein D3C73_1066000 [compost metagenome]